MASGPGRDICGLVIEEMPEDFFGDWKCFFNRELRSEHQGHFRILTKDEPFVEVNKTVLLSLFLCLSVSLSFYLSVSLPLILSCCSTLCIFLSTPYLCVFLCPSLFIFKVFSVYFTIVWFLIFLNLHFIF